jgi:hypothetical protein
MPHRPLRLRSVVPHVFGVACVASLVGLFACRESQSFPAAAQEEFSKTYSCPKERIAVTERTDLKSYDLEVGEREAPPAEVARDPGRLAEWNKRQQKLEEGYKDDHILFVKGCDHETYYRCVTGTTTQHVQTIVCMVPSHPPGSAKAAAPADTPTATPTAEPAAPPVAIPPPGAPKKVKK